MIATFDVDIKEGVKGVFKRSSTRSPHLSMSMNMARSLTSFIEKKQVR